MDSGSWWGKGITARRRRRPVSAGIEGAVTLAHIIMPLSARRIGIRMCGRLADMTSPPVIASRRDGEVFEVFADENKSWIRFKQVGQVCLDLRAILSEQNPCRNTHGLPAEGVAEQLQRGGLPVPCSPKSHISEV